ncbi:DUF3037 domain-containing protein [Sphingobacterium spiritivorum]|uniref:DUF3037 domain-containing protein n=1 Tax=Sphingobacterium TaxID=28453 RepID=UPI0019183633|nr:MULTISPECIES: DUF3037 domain-containing protein [Sphingobacterium]QQT27007.1 DUF3037 domain-containing protein [Sphingobacterium spiritivorum]
MKNVFEYAVVRLVPRVEREEFINVGVILYCKRMRYSGFLWQLNDDKCSVLCRDLDVDMIRQHLHSFEQICNGSNDGGKLAELDQAERFRWLTARRSTLIQCSPVHPGLTENPADTLQDLFEKLVI